MTGNATAADMTASNIHIFKICAFYIPLVLIILTFLPDMLRKASEADARDAARRAQADKPGDAPDAKNSGENMGK